MTPTEFLEVSVSLALQASLLVVVSYWVTQMTQRDAVKTQLWTLCHVLILCLVLRAVTLPRLESIQPWVGLSRAAALDVAVWQNWLGWAMLIVWGLGAIGSLILLVVDWVRVHRFLKTCQPLLERNGLSESHSDGVEETKLGGEKSLPVKLLVSPKLQSPFCWQIHKPLIVVPEFLLGFEDDERRLILRHELEHLRSGHPLSLFVQRLVEIVFWFHPLIWWSSRQAGLVREFACDEAAVASPQELVHYLRSLLKIVELHLETTASNGVAIPFGGSKGMIAKRAARLVAKSRQKTQSTATREATLRSLALSSGQLIAAIGIAIFVWTPIDLPRSHNTHWSRWPTWSARTLHSFGVAVRDYDFEGHRYNLRELLEEQTELSSQRKP